MWKLSFSSGVLHVQNKKITAKKYKGFILIVVKLIEQLIFANLKKVEQLHCPLKILI